MSTAPKSTRHSSPAAFRSAAKSATKPASDPSTKPASKANPASSLATRSAKGANAAKPRSAARSLAAASASVAKSADAPKSAGTAKSSGAKKSAAPANATAKALVRIAADLRDATRRLAFADPVAFVYRPLDYAWSAHEQYTLRFGGLGAKVLLVGMNPGPWGMAQTGVPFGEVAAVRDWLKLDAAIAKPAKEHPKRPVEGLACRRNEVSGARLWGWAADRFGSPESFFRRYFVANFCPLCFMEESGRNRTPDKLPAAEREPLFAACEKALVEVCRVLQPEWVVGVGAFAEARARAAVEKLDASSSKKSSLSLNQSARSLRKGALSLKQGALLSKHVAEPSWVKGGGAAQASTIRIGRIPHPSPASPAANRGWAKQADAAILDLSIRNDD